MTETLKITFPAICDIFNHTLLVTKLEAHDMDSGSYSFIKTYVTNWDWQYKIENTFSKWRIMAAEPRASILTL